MRSDRTALRLRRCAKLLAHAESQDVDARTFLITYRLESPVEPPDPLLDRLKSYSSWWRGGDSVWLVTTETSPSEVRDELWTAMGDAGQLLVVDVAGHSWIHAGVGAEGTARLKEHVR